MKTNRSLKNKRLKGFRGKKRNFYYDNELIEDLINEAIKGASPASEVPNFVTEEKQIYH